MSGLGITGRMRRADALETRGATMNIIPRFIAAVVATSAVFAQSTATDPRSVAKQIDIAEIDRTLKAIDVDRTSGKDGERQSAAYLEGKLTQYGIKHTRHDMKAYLSWPRRAAGSTAPRRRSRSARSRSSSRSGTTSTRPMGTRESWGRRHGASRTWPGPSGSRMSHPDL